MYASPQGRSREELQRLDTNAHLRAAILPFCRLNYGEVWEDPDRGHRIGVLDAAKAADVEKIMASERSSLALNDPPYNVRIGGGSKGSLSTKKIDDYLDFSRKWIHNSLEAMTDDSSFYIWLGADYREDFKPLPELLMLMREFPKLTPRNWITLRNQRGYGTQKNWMWVRQELLFYTLGNPSFKVSYTQIPKILRGYYKRVGNKTAENLERSLSNTIRSGNVWVDIQQVFYRMEENVAGCYAQKPLKAVERIIESSSSNEDLITDFFSHSGTTLIAGERKGRRVFTLDIDPIFSEITIRRLERYRRTGKTGWQWQTPFPELKQSQGHSST